MVGLGVKAHYVISINTVGGERRRTHSYLVGMEVLAPFLPFSDTTLIGGMLGCFITAWWEWKSRVSTLPLYTWVAVGPQIFLWCLDGVAQLLAKHFLSWKAAPFLVLWLGRAGFCYAFFYLCLLMFQSCWHLQLWVWELWGKKNPNKKPHKNKNKTQGTHHHVGPKVPCQSAFLSPPFRVFLRLSCI